MEMQLRQIDLEHERSAYSKQEGDLKLGVKTIETYRSLRMKGVSKAIIVATFPNMKAIADADGDTNDENAVVDTDQDQGN